MTKYKAIIIGTSVSGKSAMVRYLRKITNLPVAEADETLTEMNGGVYPKDSTYKMEKLAPKLVQDILNKEEIIYFTNTHYFTSASLKEAHRRGFFIIQFLLDQKKMKIRNTYRIIHEGYEDLSKYFTSMLKYQKKYIKVV